jgi:hypothetical protein
MAKSRSPEAGDSGGTTPYYALKIPAMAHLQFFILDMLVQSGGAVSVNALRDELAEFEAGHEEGQKFLHMINSMMDSGWATSESSSVERAGTSLCETYYRIGQIGSVAHCLALEFYNARQKIVKALTGTGIVNPRKFIYFEQS